jgi:hypothetical protein
MCRSQRAECSLCVLRHEGHVCTNKDGVCVLLKVLAVPSVAFRTLRVVNLLKHSCYCVLPCLTSEKIGDVRIT